MMTATTREKTARVAKKLTPLLTPAEAAEILNVPLHWLERDRAGPRRLPFIKLGATTVRYEQAAVEAFIAQQRRGVGSAPDPESDANAGSNDA